MKGLKCFRIKDQVALTHIKLRDRRISSSQDKDLRTGDGWRANFLEIVVSVGGSDWGVKQDLQEFLLGQG